MAVRETKNNHFWKLFFRQRLFRFWWLFFCHSSTVSNYINIFQCEISCFSCCVYAYLYMKISLYLKVMNFSRESFGCLGKYIFYRRDLTALSGASHDIIPTHAYARISKRASVVICKNEWAARTAISRVLISPLTCSSWWSSAPTLMAAIMKQSAP